ncbi:MAG: response regulator [Chloroflexi bacterium]|nr:response regulator [Chloroflexota bacterium]
MSFKALILIVDDNPAARETLQELLILSDYQLAFASNGFEALVKVEELAPDLILLDVMMPDMDGFEVCRRLKTEQRWRHIPIILVTALDSKEDLAQGLDAGADDFLSKPVNKLELRARVRSMLRLKSQYDVLEKHRRELETSLHLNKKFAQAFAERMETLEILHDFGLRLMDNLDTDTVLHLIAYTALELIPEAAGCVIHFLAEDEPQLLPVVFTREDDTKVVYPSLGLEEIINQVIETGQAIHISDRVVEPQRRLPELPEMRALLVTPLLSEQQPLGTLTVYSAEADVFETGYQHVLSILANQAAVAIVKARSLKERDLAQEREKQAIRYMFQRYVSPVVVDRLVEGRENLALGGRRQKISVMFADVRGFTNFSENLSPERVVEALNQHLALAVEAILAEEGTLDKFVGDAVMAFFNAPLPQPDHTLRAVRAAAAMQQAIAAYHMKLGLAAQPLNFGIGIHVGQAVVGNIGTAQQMNYTVIGDAVNLAKRLQENAEGGQIMLSQAAYTAVKDFITAEDLGLLAVKGRAASEHVYGLIGLR